MRNFANDRSDRNFANDRRVSLSNKTFQILHNTVKRKYIHTNDKKKTILKKERVISLPMREKKYLLRARLQISSNQHRVYECVYQP